MCGYSSHCVSRASSMPSLQTRLPRWPLAAQQPQWQPGGCGRPSLRNVMSKGFQLVGALIAVLVLDTACYMRCDSSGVALRRHLALGVKGVSCFGIQIILLEAWARGVIPWGSPVREGSLENLRIGRWVRPGNCSQMHAFSDAFGDSVVPCF